MADLAQVIKKAAVDAVKASYPVEVVYGSVVTAEPLTVKIGQQLTVEKNFLNLSDGIRTSIASGKITPEDRIILIKHQGGQRFTAIDVFHDEEWEPELFEETDPTVPAWAKAPQKPSYTAAEVKAAPAGYGSGERLWDNMIKDPLDVSLKTGVYGMWDGLEGISNFPERGFIGYCEVYNFNPEWRRVIAHNIFNGKTFYNVYKSDYVWHGWTNPQETNLLTAEAKVFTAADFPVSGNQDIVAVKQADDIWDVTIRGTYSYTPPEANNYLYGFKASSIAAALGFTTGASISYKATSFRVWNRDNSNQETTSLYGMGTGLITGTDGWILPGRFYTVGSTGLMSFGSWGCRSMPKNGIIEAHMYLRLT